MYKTGRCKVSLYNGQVVSEAMYITVLDNLPAAWVAFGKMIELNTLSLSFSINNKSHI